MKKRWISLLLVSAMTLSMLAGCGSSEDTAEDTSEGGEGDKITFMVPDWGVPTDEQLAAFTEETGIEVEIAEVGWVMGRRVLCGRLAGAIGGFR